MKIFSWQAKVGGDVIADGYLLAKDRKEAEEKLKYACEFSCIQRNIHQ